MEEKKKKKRYRLCLARLHIGPPADRKSTLKLGGPFRKTRKWKTKNESYFT
jgi:hypothetical protein